MTNGVVQIFPEMEKPLPSQGREFITRDIPAYSATALFSCLARRAFFRLAAFLWITPLDAALSITAEVADSCSLAFFASAATAASNFRMEVRIPLFTIRLRRFFFVSGNGGVKLPDGSTHSALHNTVAKILLFADLNALLGGLDVRQLGSPPLRILKKPSHEIISR